MKEQKIGQNDRTKVDFVYPKSVHYYEDHKVYMVNRSEEIFLVAPSALGFVGIAFPEAGENYLICELEHENAVKLRELFPFTAPSPVLKKDRTVGVGDRLGIASYGHIKVFEKYDAYPVFAQQSIRELNLTERSYDDVLDCVSFAVFREDFTRPFGADGDHLKTFSEIEYALSSGYTMITLDCSEHIKNTSSLSEEELSALYAVPKEVEKRYLDKSFTVGNLEISYAKADLARISATYDKAIEYAASVYRRYFDGKTNPPDFELSIDETSTPTTPAEHFYIADRLWNEGVVPATIAPRFCGEFQKGIDYIGDAARFEKELQQHAAIAEHFGYKLSIHSGSDKFSVFPYIGKHLHGRFHLKTAGTNWLEAMATVAEKNPQLYREVHQYALDYAFEEARKYYCVTTDLNNIPPLETLADEQLPTLFSNNDARQLIHITYGLILTARNDDGSFRFKERLYEVWKKFDSEYTRRLEKHIGRHLETIYSGFEK